MGSVLATSALATVAPPPSGCVPVSYEVSHARARSADAPSVTTVPAGKPTTALLGNLATGVEYAATVVGVCANGTRTPPSAPALFTPAFTQVPYYLVATGDTRAKKGMAICSDAGLTQCEYAGDGGQAPFTGQAQYQSAYDVLTVGAETWVSNDRVGYVSVCTDRNLTRCTKATGDGTFDSPHAMAAAPAGYYVTNYKTSTVSICAGPGLTNCVASNGSELFVEPRAILVVGDTTYVGNYNQVSICETSATLSSCVAWMGTPSDFDRYVSELGYSPNFYYVTGLAAAHGKVYVAFAYAIAVCSDRDLTQCAITLGMDLGAGYYPQFYGVTVVGDKVYIGCDTGNVYICDLAIKACTTSDGAGTFAGPSRVHLVLPRF